MTTAHLLLTLAGAAVHLGSRHRGQALAWGRRQAAGLLWDLATAHLGPMVWMVRAILQMHLARHADLDTAEGVALGGVAVGLPAELVDVVAELVDAARALSRRAACPDLAC